MVPNVAVDAHRNTHNLTRICKVDDKDKVLTSIYNGCFLCRNNFKKIIWNKCRIRFLHCTPAKWQAGYCFWSQQSVCL